MNKIQKQARDSILKKLEEGVYTTLKINACPFCQNRSYDMLSETDRFGLPVSAQLCHNCGLIYTNPILSDDCLPSFYNEEYHPLTYGKPTGDHLFNVRQGELIYHYIKEYLFQFAKEEGEIVICEVGSGASDIIHTIQQKSKEIGADINVYGTEYSEALIQKAKQDYGITLFKGETDAFIEHSIKADVFILSHVFEHMIYLESALEKIKKAISPRGILYIEVPGILDILHNNPHYDFMLEKLLIIAHNYNFTLGTLRNVLESNGFVLLKGNEEVRSVFKWNEKNDHLEQKNIVNEYHRIRYYLDSELPYIRANKEKRLEFLQSNFRNYTQEERNALLMEKHKQNILKERQLKAREVSIEDKLLAIDDKERALNHRKKMIQAREKQLTVEKSNVRLQEGIFRKRNIPVLKTIPDQIYRDIDYYREKIQKFHNIHKGERCFIIGNGPSLNKTDLSLLQDEITFGVNGIFYKYFDVLFTPTYYVVEDNHVIEDNLKIINEIDYAIKFFPDRYSDRIEHNDYTFFIPTDWDFYKKNSPYFETPRFSKDLSKIAYVGQTVTYLNLQLAFYMGCKEVYLIGVDFSYQIPGQSKTEKYSIISNQDDPNHFHPEYFGKGKKWHFPKLYNCLKVYDHSKMVYESEDRRVYNATIGGKLEVYERKDYYSLFRTKNRLKHPNNPLQYTLKNIWKTIQFQYEEQRNQQQTLFNNSIPSSVFIDTKNLYKPAKGESLGCFLSFMEQSNPNGTIYHLDENAKAIEECRNTLAKEYQSDDQSIEYIQQPIKEGLKQILSTKNYFNIAVLDECVSPIDCLEQLQELEPHMNSHSYVVVTHIQNIVSDKEYKEPRILGMGGFIIPYIIQTKGNIWINSNIGVISKSLNLPMMQRLKMDIVQSQFENWKNTSAYHLIRIINSKIKKHQWFRIESFGESFSMFDRTQKEYMDSDDGNLIRKMVYENIPFLITNGDLIVYW